MSYKRPRFVREESWRYKRVKEPWRSPKGKSSRVRRSKEGWPPVVKIGYARPKATRGRHPSGLKEVMVWRPKDLVGIDSKTQAARIAHTVGENKRVQILEDAKKANIRILNPGLKKPAEIVPETVTEPTAPTVEPPAPTESATETTTEATEGSAPKSDTKGPEKPAKKEPKKRRTGKSGKKRNKE
ncbi:MAG: 50S ribosomal protein L32e [Candidatus Bathyarchaeia archaeon]